MRILFISTKETFSIDYIPSQFWFEKGAKEVVLCDGSNQKGLVKVSCDSEGQSIVTKLAEQLAINQSFNLITIDTKN